MINYLSGKTTLASEGQKLSETYAQNKPWPHIVLDDFIDPEVLEQVRGEAAAVRRSDYYEKFVECTDTQCRSRRHRELSECQSLSITIRTVGTPKIKSTQLFFTSRKTIKCVSDLLAFIVPWYAL
jgi:hypothetical protein